MTETLQIRRRGFIFDWAGGPYIDIARADRPNEPFDVINVTDTSEPFTRQGLMKLLESWQGGFKSAPEAFRMLSRTAYDSLGAPPER